MGNCLWPLQLGQCRKKVVFRVYDWFLQGTVAKARVLQETINMDLDYHRDTDSKGKIAQTFRMLETFLLLPTVLKRSMRAVILSPRNHKASDRSLNAQEDLKQQQSDLFVFRWTETETTRMAIKSEGKTKMFMQRFVPKKSPCICISPCVRFPSHSLKRNFPVGNELHPQKCGYNWVRKSHLEAGWVATTRDHTINFTMP